MAKKSKPKMVRCRYPKCMKMHESNELLKSEAIKSGKGSSYYHKDCYHTMQTINKIRDTFYEKINPMMTGKQIGSLVSTVNNMVFEKKIDVDYILFALEYFIKNKPGKLHSEFGMHYIVQDRDVKDAWKKEQERQIRKQIEEHQINLVDPVGGIGSWELSDTESTQYKSNNKSKFSSVLGV